MIKNLYKFLLVFLLPIVGVSQIYEPVKWNFSKQQISESSYELIFTEDIDRIDIYSNDLLNGKWIVMWKYVQSQFHSSLIKRILMS